MAPPDKMRRKVLARMDGASITDAAAVAILGAPVRHIFSVAVWVIPMAIAGRLTGHQSLVFARPRGIEVEATAGPSSAQAGGAEPWCGPC